jgi:hypothetical protein
MKVTTSVVAVFFLIILCGVALGCSGANTVVQSSAQSFVWVSPDGADAFIGEVKQFAKDESLSFTYTKIPGPWDINYMKLMTPGENEIVVSNATARNKYSVSITIYNKEEKWNKYWMSLREFISKDYKWRDM